MFGLLGTSDNNTACTALVENYRLQNAGDYMALVSSGMTDDYSAPDKPIADHGNDDFELFYGVQNDPNLKALQSAGMDGLGCGDNCDCPCNKNKGVSGLAGNLGPNYGSWPPGPRPDPYRWRAPDGTTWTLVNLDNKWVYQSSKDRRMFISASNLYDLMGVKKDDNLLAVGLIPGEPHPDAMARNDWSNWSIAGIGAGWVILGAVGVYAYVQHRKRGH